MWQELSVDSVSMKRKMKIVASSGKTGQGLADGFEWIVDTIADL